MHLGGHSFSQIWHATQRSPASQSPPSYTRNGKFREASGSGSRSSGYCTVVIRSLETKLPTKFFAVSPNPFSIPSPSNRKLLETVVSDQRSAIRAPNTQLAIFLIIAYN